MRGDIISVLFTSLPLHLLWQFLIWPKSTYSQLVSLLGDKAGKYFEKRLFSYRVLDYIIKCHWNERRHHFSIIYKLTLALVMAVSYMA